MIKVLIVEDSHTAQLFLSNILSKDPSIQVIGTASDGIAALEFLSRSKPDVITMDFYMPRMNGLEVTRRIMETEPVPIVIVSTFAEEKEREKVFQFLEAGAVAVIDKPVAMNHPSFATQSARLIQTVKNMSEVKLVRRRPTTRSTHGALEAMKPLPPQPQPPFKPLNDVELIAIGASTGGPAVMKVVLEGLQRNHPPVVAVQHIAKGFLPGLVAWLENTTRLKVTIAELGETLERGRVYFAPEDKHMGVTNQLRVQLSDAPAMHGLRPAISHLFQSIAVNKLGPHSIGVLMTGMGADGACELKMMRDAGAITIAQDKETSIVYGMPGEAVKLNAAQYVLPPDKIVKRINEILSLQPIGQGLAPEAE